MVLCHGGFSWLFRPLFRRLLNLSWTGASLLKGLQSARPRLLHQNCTRNVEPFAQSMRENVNFFKTWAQLLHHIVQYTLWKNKGRGRNKSQASRSVDVCTQNINFTLQFEEGLFFIYKVFVKPSSFSPEWQRGNDRKCFCLSPISTSQERVKALSWMPPILQIFAHIFPFSTLKKLFCTFICLTFCQYVCIPLISWEYFFAHVFQYILNTSVAEVAAENDDFLIISRI